MKYLGYTWAQVYNSEIHINIQQIMENSTMKNYCVVRTSNLGSEIIKYYQYVRPEKCQEEGCKRCDEILYPHNKKRYCFYCWSQKKYYSDEYGFEKGKQTIIGKKIVKKNAFFSKAEVLNAQGKISKEEFDNFKALYTSDKKKARRYIKRVFRKLGL